MWNTRRELYINFFLKIFIQEDIFNIKLRDKSLTNQSYCNKSTTSSHFCNINKCLLIIHTILLRVSFCNQPNFVSLNRPSELVLILYIQRQPTTLLLGGRGTKSQIFIRLMYISDKVWRTIKKRELQVCRRVKYQY
jgi:hypothetical protein